MKQCISNSGLIYFKNSGMITRIYRHEINCEKKYFYMMKLDSKSESG